MVAGRLTNALTGEPVKKATVRLTANRAGANGTALMATAAGRFPPGGQGYSTTTDNEGSFRIEGVNPGEYRLMANRSGFLATSYGAKGPNRSGSVIRLDPRNRKQIWRSP